MKSPTYAPPDGQKVKGRLVGMRSPGSVIRDSVTGNEWPGVQFKVQPEVGKAFWTVTLPDKSRLERVREEGKARLDAVDGRWAE